MKRETEFGFSFEIANIQNVQLASISANGIKI